MTVAVNRPWPARYFDAEGANTILNLHHDKNNRAERTVTVLIYLSGGPEDDAESAPADRLRGGHTAFPCVKPVGRGPVADMGDLCRRLVTGYDAGERMLEPAGPGFDPLVAKAHRDLCRLSQIDATKERAVLAPPRRGSALLFWSAPPDDMDAGLRHMWHGACRVMQGEKWTLQKFKQPPGRSSLPPRVAPPVAPPDPAARPRQQPPPTGAGGYKLTRWLTGGWLGGTG